MKKRLKYFLDCHKKGLVGFGIYYIVFTLFSLYSFWKGWHIRVLILALTAFLLLISIGGDEDYSSRWKIYLRDPGMAPDVPTGRDRLTEALPFFTSLFLVLPPIAYIIVDILVGNPLI